MDHPVYGGSNYMTNIGQTTVKKTESKDEYWGYWEICDHCKSDMIIPGSRFCPQCGFEIVR